MNDKLENMLFIAVCVLVGIKETVLSSPSMIFILGVLAALGAILFFQML